MTELATWIVLANARSAQICVSNQGATHRIMSLDGRAPYSFGWLPSSSPGIADPCNPGLATNGNREKARRTLFASEIVVGLMRHVRAEYCDRVMIVATPEMLSALRLASPAYLSRFLISEVEMPANWGAESQADLATASRSSVLFSA